MGVIEDVRTALQDFVAPELRALSARLDALEKRMDSLEQHMDERFKASEKHMDERFESLRQQIQLNHMAIMGALDLDRRVRLVEVAVSEKKAG
jgi:hypothetical protein